MHFPSVHNVIAWALVAAPLVAAHGKIAIATGDQGGNGTALGIQGGIIPGAGPNSATEPDTTVFQGKAANGCGKTTGVRSLLSLSPSLFELLTNAATER